MKHWTLLHALQLNGRTVFNSKLILMLRVFFRSFLDIWTQARVWAWFLKPVSNSDAIQNCRPTPKWYSTGFLIWGCENNKSSMWSRRILEYSPCTFYQSNQKSKITLYCKSEELHMQYHLIENFQPFVVLKPSTHIKNHQLPMKYTNGLLITEKKLAQIGTRLCLFHSNFFTLFFRCLV